MKTWNKVTIKYLKDNFEKFNDEDLARHISHMVNRKVRKIAVRKKRQRLGLKKNGYRSFWESV